MHKDYYMHICQVEIDRFSHLEKPFFGIAEAYTYHHVVERGFFYATPWKPRDLRLAELNDWRNHQLTCRCYNDVTCFLRWRTVFQLFWDDFQLDSTDSMFLVIKSWRTLCHCRRRGIRESENSDPIQATSMLQWFSVWSWENHMAQSLVVRHG